MENSQPALDRIYTADEAAERLRLTRRAIITLGKRYGCCSLHGRTVSFSEQDLLDLWQMMRAEAKEPRPRTVQAAPLPGSSFVWFRDQARKKQQAKEERARQRKADEAKERERRLAAKVEAARLKREQRVARMKNWQPKASEKMSEAMR